jgi:hypothetical protein
VGILCRTIDGGGGHLTPDCEQTRWLIGSRDSSGDLRVVDRLNEVWDALTAYPMRTDCITTFLFPTLFWSLHLKTQNKLLRLFYLVRPNLETLGIIGESKWSSRPASEIVQLARDEWSFVKLRSLRFATGNLLDIPYFLRFLAKCPGLVNLEFHFLNGHTSRLDQRHIPAQGWLDLIPPLPHLTHLALTNFAHPLFVPALLERTPNLTDFTLRGRWSTPDEAMDYAAFLAHDNIPNALPKLKKLETVNWLTKNQRDSLLEKLCAIESLNRFVGTTKILPEEHELDLHVSACASAREALMP